LIVHTLIVAFWLGALAPLLLAVRLETPAAAGRIVAGFSAYATWLVPVILVAGLALSILLLPNLASLLTPYGKLLLSKVTVFAVLMGFAALNKWRLGPGISGGDAAALRAFSRSVLAEWGLILAVVAVTAFMTGLYSP
jgi:putative copper export protein